MELHPDLSRPVEQKFSAPGNAPIPALREGIQAGATRQLRVQNPRHLVTRVALSDI
jgi:hypothetical protein